MSLRFPTLPMLPLERYSRLLDPERFEQLMARVANLRARLVGRVVWNVSSTAVSGGVAEMVRSILSYARGGGVDARWAVIDGPPEFFRVTKRLHNAIHGSRGDGSPIGEGERRLFEHVNAENAAQLTPMVRPLDVVIVHDPQPAGMIRALVECGANVVWRCHIGHDDINDEVHRGWRFLAPYVHDAAAYVFSRPSYVPAQYIDARRAKIIAPTVDPFSAKNQLLDERNVLAILEHAGLIQHAVDTGTGMFTREDGTPSRVDHAAEIIREDAPPAATAPLIVQVSRWDKLKDPSGVLEGFTRLDHPSAHLVLAGPNVNGVADDPEGAAVLSAVTARWHQLPTAMRRRIHLASLPTFDIEENAAIVNALQRHATVVVQKSLHEGFGLTVTEAMWKARPVVASAVGGIRDQIDDGVEGLLIADATDLDAFAAALARLLRDPAMARQMGIRGHARVLARCLALNSLLSYGALIEWIDERRTPQWVPSAASIF